MPTLSSACGFIMGLGKRKLCTKVEVASFSHYKNIKGEAQIVGRSRSPGPHPLFLLVGFHDGPKQTADAGQI